MKTSTRSLILFISLICCTTAYGQNQELNPKDITISRKLVRQALADTSGYHMLRELTALGHRLPGSENAARAVIWAKAKMESLGLENVQFQECPVPHWERGNVETAFIQGVNLEKINLSIAALGGSIGTPASGITVEVLEVQSFEELKQKQDLAKGKIIFFNRPMDPGMIATFAAYGGAVGQRGSDQWIERGGDRSHRW